MEPQKTEKPDYNEELTLLPAHLNTSYQSDAIRLYPDVSGLSAA
jgi:hypothetical protein